MNARLEAARALLEPWDGADLDRVEWASRILEGLAAPEVEVLPVVARATRVVHFLRQRAAAGGDSRMSAAAAELERSARALLEAAER